MAFKLKRGDREVLWPVLITQSRDDGSGGLEKSRDVKVRYRVLTDTEVKEFFARPDVERVQIVNDLLEKHIVGWEGIVDEDTNEPIPFNLEMLRTALDQIPIQNALLAGLLDCSRGAERKN